MYSLSGVNEQVPMLYGPVNVSISTARNSSSSLSMILCLIIGTPFASLSLID